MFVVTVRLGDNGRDRSTAVAVWDMNVKFGVDWKR